MNKQLVNLNIYKFVRLFSRYLNTHFLPILIFQTTQSLTLALLYLALISVFTIIFNLGLKKIIVSHIKISLIFSALIFTVMQLLLIFNNMNIYIYAILLAILSGLDNVLTLSTFDYLYNTCPNSENVRHLKNTYIVENVATAIAPFVGGLILTYLGVAYNASFAILTCIISVVYIVVYMYKSNYKLEINQPKLVDKVEQSDESIDKPLKSKINSYVIFAVLMVLIIGVMSRMGMSWALYLKVIDTQYSLIGALSGMIALGQIFFAIITYKVQLKNKGFILVILSSVILGVCWALRPFFTNLVGLYIFTIIIGLVNPFLMQPVKEIYLCVIKKYCKPDSILYMNAFIRHLGCIILSIIGVLLSLISVNGIQIMFIIGATSIFLIPLIYYYIKNKS